MALLTWPKLDVVGQGLAERLGEEHASIAWEIGQYQHHIPIKNANHPIAMQQMLDHIFQHFDKPSIAAVGHRVVHGGELFVHPTLLSMDVIVKIECISHLAPLHNPANMLGVRLAMQALPEVGHVAVFDTAFHHTMPDQASLYAVPYAWYRELGVRRYGFHGTSHRYVAEIAAAKLGLPFHDCCLLTAHLGNGCSAAAVLNGCSVDTTMGLTPLEGLMMGTRSGDVDPGLLEFVSHQTGQSLVEITSMLNKKSGLLGVSEQSNDMRTLILLAADGHAQAKLAIDMFCYRLAKALAGLAVALGRVDGIVFTGGIGEHASEVREKTLQQLGILGVCIDRQRNIEHGCFSDGVITQALVGVPALVVATSEETMIARDVAQCLWDKDKVL